MSIPGLDPNRFGKRTDLMRSGATPGERAAAMVVVDHVAASANRKEAS